MTIFNALTLIGGLSLFLFGMSLMGQALERRAGGKLRTLLGKLTDHKIAGLLTGLGLSIVKHAAQIHNAKIDVKSTVGEGTSVTIVFREN